MTTDPNDVDAWLDQFAPEVDRTTPSPDQGPEVLDESVYGTPTGFGTAPGADTPPAFTAEPQQIDPIVSAVPQSTFSAPAAAPGFPAPMERPAVAPPAVGIPVEGPAVAPQVQAPIVPQSQLAADGLTSAQVGSTVGLAWDEGDWSEEKFAQATGGVPQVNAEADFSMGLESALPKADGGRSHVVGFLVEWLPIIIGAAIVAALVRTFVFQAFFIPSGSMMPTLQEQDRVLVNKLSYDFNDVGWGDVVVFKRPPGAPGTVDDLIKRVMALPGDTIEVFNGDVYVNNVRVEESYLLQQGVSTRLRGDPIPAPCIDATPDRCTVPEGYVFVMGDNRGGSTDSRSFGPIPIDDIVGRAVVRVWPLDALTVF